jgi:4-alpha-glucanotransferase
MSERKAGILLHISSLPSAFGIGDLGPAAFSFVDLLARCDQRIWQILPLNPVETLQSFSPYSSVCSSAGNFLLISPEILVRDGLLNKSDLKQWRQPNISTVDFHKLLKEKTAMLELAWNNAKQNSKKNLGTAFKKFCDENAEWLDDFALYSVIKVMKQNKPWFEWPEKLKKRDPETLSVVRKSKKQSIEKIKFIQFIFEKQWQALKNYAAGKGIQILGDLAFYVSYDSTDVWSNPRIFKINDRGKLLAVAGTPPDLFSAKGQLWNMPVYNWNELKKTGYDWWVNRIRRNTELFHMLRLDHFRGFAGYWEVNAKDKTAKNGTWKKGPGADFFKTLKSSIPGFPLIAEDLGEITKDVIKLREQFGFPGMKVLQFAFGDNMPVSEHIPHNYGRNFFVFTGTHDNNTTRGWYEDDIDDRQRKRVEEYCSYPLSGENVAEALIRVAYASVAQTVIIPMQDVLNLDSKARMNKPGEAKYNWNWRLDPQAINSKIEARLKKWVAIYRRKLLG